MCIRDSVDIAYRNVGKADLAEKREGRNKTRDSTTDDKARQHRLIQKGLQLTAFAAPFDQGNAKLLNDNTLASSSELKSTSFRPQLWTTSVHFSLLETMLHSANGRHPSLRGFSQNGIFCAHDCSDGRTLTGTHKMKSSVGAGAVLIILTLTAAHEVTTASPADAVNSLATAWLRENTERNPASATEDTGWMAPLAARVFDNTPGALTRWHRHEDSVLAQLKTIDTVALAGKPEWTTYGILRYSLESSVGSRICRGELWNISSYVTGWQQGYTDVAARQRVGTAARRTAALARARALPKFIDNEIANLREGVRQGYTAPDAVVRNVIR